MDCDKFVDEYAQRFCKYYQQISKFLNINNDILNIYFEVMKNSLA